jgi:hypothetical protein
MNYEEIRRMKKWCIVNLVIIVIYLIHALVVFKIGFQLPEASEILNNKVGNGYWMLLRENGILEYEENAFEGKKFGMIFFSLFCLMHLAGIMVLIRKEKK